MKMVLYSTKKCNVCKALIPKLEIIKENYDIGFEILYTEENLELTSQKLIFASPVLTIEDGEIEYKRWVRVFSIIEVEDYIKKIRL